MKADRLPSGAYRYRVWYYTADGKRHAKSFTDHDREAAKRAALTFETGARLTAPAPGTVGSAISAYISGREPLLSPSTIKAYKSMHERLKNDFSAFCGYAVSGITREEVQETLNALSESGSSPKTIRNYAGLITGALREKGVLLSGLVLPKKKMRDVTVPSEEIVREILALAENSELEIPIMLAAFAGLRRGEVCALKEEDIDFKECVIHVCRDIVQNSDRVWVEKPPKTKASDRYVELPKKSLARIKKMGLPDMTPQVLTRRFERFLIRHKIPHFRFHDLRHFCASYMHAQGIPDAYIMQRCGWENDEVLKAIYRHTLADQDKRFVKQINTSFSSFL